ncbi:MAG: primosomal protein N' [Bacillota bacterium]
MSTRFVDVIVDVPALMDRQFTYELPDNMFIPRGAKVRVPFGQGEADGFVMGESTDPPSIKVRPIKFVYDLGFLPDDHLMRLAEVLAERCCVPLSSSLALLWPPFVPREMPGSPHDAGSTLPHGAASAAPCGASSTAPRGTSGTSPVVLSSVIWGDSAYRWERYFGIIAQAREEGRGVIVLVPELKGLEDAVVRLKGAFGDDVAAVHSELTGLQRRAAHLALQSGEKSIAVGTRAAVFAPVRRLGIIIVDEESSESYTSPESPFYDSREVAVWRAGIEGCRVVLGSGHPTVVAMGRAALGTSALETQIPRPDLPPVHVVDLRGQKRGRSIMAEPLVSALRETFASSGRAVLFLNRKGDFTQVTCRDCGETLACEACSLPLAFHSKDSALVCHTCGRRVQAPDVCPKCGGSNWYFGGFGINRAESEFRRLFPDVPLYRLDKDSSKGEPPKRVISAFGADSPSCLLATATVLRSGGMPSVTTVGVLSTDTILNLPDFRASEKVYHLLCSLRELADPAAPGASLIVQTLNPENPGVKGAADPQAYYREELGQRKILGYPPFGTFVRVHFHGKKLERVRDAAASYADSAMSLDPKPQVLGPSPAPKPKVRGEYWFQVALRGQDPAPLCALHRQAQSRLGGGVKVSVQVDSI